ncbi:putative metal chaperone YciC [compost metagenome]
MLQHWTPEVGDCRQELVFIGQGIDFQRLRAELDACLLEDHEMALGPDGWSLLPDPFDPWLVGEAG